MPRAKRTPPTDSTACTFLHEPSYFRSFCQVCGSTSLIRLPPVKESALTIAARPETLQGGAFDIVIPHQAAAEAGLAQTHNDTYNYIVGVKIFVTRTIDGMPRTSLLYAGAQAAPPVSGLTSPAAFLRAGDVEDAHPRGENSVVSYFDYPSSFPLKPRCFSNFVRFLGLNYVSNTLSLHACETPHYNSAVPAEAGYYRTH